MQALFVDNLTVIDFAYFDHQRGIVGESLIMNVTLYGELNDEGMLFDFSFVKKRIKSCVDELVDHKFLVATNNRFTHIEDSLNTLTLNLTSQSGDTYQHISPHQAVCLIESEFVTAESIEKTINQAIMKILPDNVKKIEITLNEESIKGPFYHYSHGLKKHLGDCQRIAHGHRSKIEVWENGEFSEYWSDYIAKEWKDIYLATSDDLIESENNSDYRVQYHANQGMFQLTLPKAQCQIMDTDTTVELIAVFLAEKLKQQKPESSFKVKAYEGVDKGAIAEV